jgi:hypothetical protein
MTEAERTWDPSTWRYRMVRDDETGDVAVCEVYSLVADENVHPGWTGPIMLVGEDRDELREKFLMVARALVEPILTPDEGGKFLVEERNPA